MLLTKITLDNVGVYRGSNEFDLETTPQKPIILYGGVNGAGKTTLFESIPLCLYGQKYTEDRIVPHFCHGLQKSFSIYPNFGVNKTNIIM